MKAFEILKAFHDLTNGDSRNSARPIFRKRRAIDSFKPWKASAPWCGDRADVIARDCASVPVAQCDIAELLRDATCADDGIGALLGAHVHLGVLETWHGHYVAKVSGPAPCLCIRGSAPVGSLLRGTGQSAAGCLPEEEMERFILDGELIALTPIPSPPRRRCAPITLVRGPAMRGRGKSCRILYRVPC